MRTSSETSSYQGQETDVYYASLTELRAKVHEQVPALPTYEARWDKLRQLVVEYKFGSEEFTLLGHDIHLFTPVSDDT